MKPTRADPTPFRRAATRACRVAVAAAVASAPAAYARADGALGPEFGSNSVTSEIVDVAGTPDVDEFVADLAAGEKVSAEVRAVSGSSLHPGVSLVGPDGSEFAVGAPSARDPGVARLAPVAVPATGRWCVRVFGADATEGAYKVRFRVASPKARTTGGKLGGGSPVTAEFGVDAADGAVAKISIVARGPSAVRVVAIADPAGDPIATVPERTTTSGTRTVLSKLPLLAGTGVYRVTLGIESGSASYSVRTSLTPPSRPAGSSNLAPTEPFLPLRAAPLEGLASQPLRIPASQLARSTLPSVWFGGVPGTVLQVGPAGSYVDVVPPPAPDGSLVALTVANADGQSTTRPDYFRYLPASTPPLRAITPAVTQIYANELATFYIDANVAAPPTGRQVTLSVTNKIATFPSKVTIPAGTVFGEFVVQAASTSGSGLLTATAGNAVSATVTILPARRADLSSWRIVQANAAATFTIPAGTVVEGGGFLVVARNATRAAFEGYWGRTLGPNVVFLNSGGTFPLIDGAERYSLTLPSGVTVDGQTIALATGTNYARTPGKPAGTTSSWTIAPATGFNASPGTGPATTVALPYISEFSDVAAGGNNAYQFVEIRFDRGQ